VAKIVALIPAFNEEKRITKTVEGLKKISDIDRVIVVDDGSTDDTAKLAEKAGAEVVSLKENLGKGGALNRVLKTLDYDILLLIDGDLSESAAEAGKLLEPVIAGDVDMAIADFPKPDTKGGFGLVKGVARWGIRRLTGAEMNEPLSGQRAIRRAVIEKISEFSDGFGVEVGMTIDALQKGFKVKEVPTTMSHAETGRDIRGFIHRGRQFLDVLKVILNRLR